MNPERVENLKYNNLDNLQLENFDFVFLEPEVKQRELEDQIMNRFLSLKKDRLQRYEDEFSHNKGLYMMKFGGVKHVVSSLYQCFLSLPVFVKQMIVEEHFTMHGTKIQKLMISIFQD